MAAYVIVDVTVIDPKNYEEYKKLTPASVAAYGGKFLARGGITGILEGDWVPGRLVIVEFPSVEIAQEWWDSPMYKKARQIREKAANTNMVVVEGI